MEELIEFILQAISILIPKRMQNWIMRQNRILRMILQTIFYLLAVSLCVLICMLLFLLFCLIANTFFGGHYGIKDFEPSWVLIAIMPLLLNAYLWYQRQCYGNVDNIAKYLKIKFAGAYRMICSCVPFARKIPVRKRREQRALAENDVW